jgi:UDP-N-acetyl-D-mannosaminuronate dehydrogenase
VLIEILRKNGAEVYWYDPLVQRWLGEESHAPKKKDFDLSFVAILHSDMDLDLINKSSEIVFDATGIFTQAAHL